MARGPGGKMAVTIPCLAVRGSTGVSLSYGPGTYGEVSSFVKDDSKLCRAMAFSPDGKYFAWVSPPVVKIVLTSTWEVTATIEKPKACAIQFSPLGTYFMTWEPFVVTQANPQGNPQLHIWKSESGKHVKSFIQKRQVDWAPQWSEDEKLCGILIHSEVFFYENADFEKIIQKINLTNKIAKFKIAPGATPYHIVCYLPGKSGQPAIARLFQYPKFESTESLANKSFFQADRIDFYWNKKGTSVLLLTSMDVDKTGASYYGKQALHYLSTDGTTSMVSFSKEGPIHALEWSPKSNEFCVTYGSMPTQTTLFNLKCESVFEFGKNYRNSSYYNPHGNIIILGGFGNLQGKIELWDLNKKKLIAQSDAPDTTLLQWSPDGEHFMTATTAPRLRMANGFKIWHYTGTLLYERPWNKQEELWEVLWQTFPPTVFPEKPISYKAVEGITPSAPQPSKEVYRPPSARGLPNTFKLRDDLPPLTEFIPSKAALKKKKKREANKVKKEQEDVAVPKVAANGQGNNVAKAQKPAPVHSKLTLDPEKNKKIKAVTRKLDQILKLKEQLAAGRKLELNQQDKIKKEDELLKELHELSL